MHAAFVQDTWGGNATDFTVRTRVWSMGAGPHDLSCPLTHHVSPGHPFLGLSSGNGVHIARPAMIYLKPKGEGEAGKTHLSHPFNETFKEACLALLGLSFLICKVEIIIGPASYKLSGELNELIHAESWKYGSERVKDRLGDTEQIFQLTSDLPGLTASPQNPEMLGWGVLRLREGSHLA